MTGASAAGRAIGAAREAGLTVTLAPGAARHRPARRRPSPPRHEPTPAAVARVEGPRTPGALSAAGSAGWPANEAVGPLRLLAAEDPDGPAPLPGQFYMLRGGAGLGRGGGRPHLGRAFSVCRVRGERLEFLLEAIGPGTERLAELEPGDGLWLVGPLGIGFTEPPDGEPRRCSSAAASASRRS